MYFRSEKSKTMGTLEIMGDERMSYVLGMLMDNIMGSTLADTSAFGHSGEAGMVNDFESRICDEHLQDLCRTSKNADSLFKKMKAIQIFYNEEKGRLETRRAEFIRDMHTNLNKQFNLRPASKEETTAKITRIEEKMDLCLARLQWYCNRLLVQLQIHTSRNKRRRNLDPNSIAILRTWFDKHQGHPYPSEAEKDELSEKSGLTLGQIATWFVNARARYPWRQKALPG